MCEEILSNEDNRLNRVEIFESLFHISERLNRQDKKIFLYGLNEDTKKAFVFLNAFHVSVEGFILTKEQQELNGILYLGHPVIGAMELLKEKNDSYIVLDVYGENYEQIKDALETDRSMQRLFETKEKHIAIYGAGESGRCLCRLLCRCGIKPDFFVDRNADTIQEIEGCQVMSPDELDEKDRDCFFAIAIDDWNVADEVRRMLQKKDCLKSELFDSLFWKLRFNESIWLKRGKEYHAVFKPFYLRYIYKLLLKKKKICLYSDDVPYLMDAVAVLQKLGITQIHRGVSSTIKENVSIGDFKICNAFELIYEDLSEYVICTLEGEEDHAKQFMLKSGIDKEKFLYGSTGPLYLDRTYILDVHLGYIDSRGSIVRRNCPDGNKAVKVAVFGGSTSDYDLYYEKSWPACLLELAREKGIGMECVCAATAGNTSGMELIRFIRDVLWQKPDIVISYSRINEITHTVGKHKFAHIYQKTIFDKLSHTKAVDSFFGLKRSKTYSMGEELDDAAYVWINNERMLHALCMEYGISFYAFLQPFLYEKKPRTLRDSELIEHLCDDDPGMISGLTALGKNVKQYMEEYPWLHDFTEVFDHVDEEVFFDCSHLLESANRLVAEKILSILTEGHAWEERIC